MKKLPHLLFLFGLSQLLISCGSAPEPNQYQAQCSNEARHAEGYWHGPLRKTYEEAQQDADSHMKETNFACDQSHVTTTPIVMH